MKTIKIFLASSEELDYDRMAFGNLVRRLDDIYEKRGIRIKLFEWEDYDSAYNDKRKQDEYNEYVKQSDIFLALFHKKAGKFTIEEFDKASEQFKTTASPKVYTYCKDLKPGDEESPELKEFKERLFNEMGHYWCRYDNRESLQFQFVMQLQLVESNRMDDVKVEDGVVTVNGLPVAKMENLKFAAANDDYLRMQSDIQELRKEIEEMQLDLEKKQRRLEIKKAKLEESPDDEDCQEDYKEKKEEVEKLTHRLQPKLNKYNKLKEDFAKHQEFLFNTAKRVTKLQGEHINDRIRRAIDALNNGLVREANTILNEAEEDAKNLLNEYKQSKEITEQKRQNLFISIKELSLKATTIMADASILIDDRVKQAEDIYELADSIAQEINYAQEKYIDFFWDYSRFLGGYAHYDKALEVLKRLIKLCEEFYGKEHPDTAMSYNNIGIVYKNRGKYDKALEYYQKALVIQEKVLGKEHPNTATSYNNIGNVYSDRGEYDKAMEFHKLALDIEEKVLGKEHSDSARSYNNIGNVYANRGDYDKALEYYMKSLDIREKVLGKEHPKTAASYNNIGNVYYYRGDYDKALDYYKQALDIKEKVLGKEHPDTARSYGNIGLVYKNRGDYDKALEYYKLALVIQEKVLGKEHPDTARSYGNIGLVYKNRGDYNKALEFYKKAAEQDDAEAQCRLAFMYDNGQGTEQNYDKAIEWYRKAAEQGHARAQCNLGYLYEVGHGVEMDKTIAVEWYQKAAEQGYKPAYNELAWTYHLMGKYEEALPWAERAISVEPSDPAVIDTIATVYQGLGRYNEAMKQFKLCLKLRKEQNQKKEKIHETEVKIAELKDLMK